VLGLLHLAISKRIQILFSDSPWNFEIKLLADILKNVVWHSVATALANIVFPVPGGPNRRIDFHVYIFRDEYIPFNFKGRKTASFIMRFAY